MTPLSALAEERQILKDVDWAQYESYLHDFEGRHFRLTYDRGTLEIMTVSPWHERAKKLLGRLLEALAEELDLPLLGLGNFTLKEAAISRGLEPDDCWYTRHEKLVRDKREINLQVDPPPDLVVEVEVSRSALDRMQIYATLKVPEIWRFDGETLTVCLLGNEGEYTESLSSPTFPQVLIEGLPRFLAQWDKVEQTQLVKSFRAWVRTILAG